MQRSGTKVVGLPMRIACVLLPRFPLAVELLDRPELRGRPVILGGAPEEPAVVLECTVQAERFGVRRGITLREALARCRDAVFLEAHPARSAGLFERVLDALELVSPVVEPAQPGCALIDLTGLPDAAAPGGEARLAAALIGAVKDAVAMTPWVGIADDRFTAWAAAVSLFQPASAPVDTESAPPRTRIVPPGAAAAFVATLPADRLPLSVETLRRLAWLGLRTAGDLAALSRGALAAQFGPEGILAWNLAHGADDRPLVPRRHQPTIVEAIDFPQPTVEAPAILAAAHHLIGRLLRRPECARRAVRGLTLRAALANGHQRHWLLTFREPTADRERMLRALAAKLDGAAFPAAVESIAIHLRDLCGETGLQSSLFSNHAQHLQNLEAALAQLHARFDRPLIMKIVGVEPWSRIPERQFALMPVGATAEHAPAFARSTSPNR